MPDQQQPQKPPASRAALAIGAFLIIVAVIASGRREKQAAPAPPAAMPAYCGETGTDRLPQCGWTPEKQKAMDDAEQKQKDAERWVAERFMRAADCNKPASQMSPTEVDDCRSDPGGIPWARGR